MARSPKASNWSAYNEYSANDSFVVAIDGMEATRSLESLNGSVLKAAVRALNRAAERTRTQASRQIREQVAFPASYLNPSQGRLTVSAQAREDNLEAVISARVRPTMLARFASGGTVGKAGVSVQVAPGFAKFMKRAFLIRLPAGRTGGSDGVETKSNLGLAIRLKPGEVIQNKKVMQRIGKKGNLYILYGPSVSQVFQSVREDVSPDAAEFLATEFARLLELDEK